MLRHGTEVGQGTKIDQGVYTFTGLEAGTHNVSVTPSKFADQNLTDMTLTAGQSLPPGVTLLAQSAQSKISVEAKDVAQVEVLCGAL